MDHLVAELLFCIAIANTNAVLYYYLKTKCIFNTITKSNTVKIWIAKSFAFYITVPKTYASWIWTVQTNASVHSIYLQKNYSSMTWFLLKMIYKIDPMIPVSILIDEICWLGRARLIIIILCKRKNNLCRLLSDKIRISLSGIRERNIWVSRVFAPCLRSIPFKINQCGPIISPKTQHWFSWIHNCICLAGCICMNGIGEYFKHHYSYGKSVSVFSEHIYAHTGDFRPNAHSGDFGPKILYLQNARN